MRLNSSPEAVEALNNLPIREVNGTVIYIRDVAQVHDGFAVQTNIVRRDGRRSSLLTVLKNGRASTLDVVARVQEALPRIQATLPKGLDLEVLFDQSLFVEASIHGVLVEGLIAACLTALMILLFLGSWRSTLIVTISIPLSVLCSIIAMSLLGQTLNIMTLGGLALSVGILVDDATVEIENIHRNLGQGKPLRQAILEGAEQIAVPALVSTLTICIVFVPVVFLTQVAKSLFLPLAMAVVFAMLASYLLSRTVVPMLVNYLLKGEAHLYTDHDAHRSGSGFHNDHKASSNHAVPAKNIFWRIHEKFNRQFEKFRDRYRKILSQALNHRRTVFALFGAFWVSALVLLPFVGQDFFPRVDAGQFRLHVRAPAGTRIEETERIFAQVEDVIR